MVCEVVVPEIATVILPAGWLIGTVPVSEKLVLLFTVTPTQLIVGSVPETKIIVDPWRRVTIGVISSSKVSPGTREIVVSIVNPLVVELDGELMPDADEDAANGVVSGVGAEEAIDSKPDDDGKRPPVAEAREAEPSVADEPTSPLVAGGVAVAAELDADTTTKSRSTTNVPPAARSTSISTTIVPGWVSIGTVPVIVMPPFTLTRVAQSI